MKEDPIIFNLNLDLRVLAVLGLVIILLTFAYGTSGARGEDPLNTNTMQVKAAAIRSSSAPVVKPSPPAGMQDAVLTTNGEWIPLASVGAAPAASAAPAGVSAAGSGRHFYLTHSSYSASTAKTACAAGYHMASFWEILAVSNLVYDYDHPAAETKSDSGFGPPSYWYGRVRTGQDSSSSNVTGSGNCLNWTSASSLNYGVSVRLSRTWETAPGDIFTWDATSFGCDVVGPVWCVRDN